MALLGTLGVKLTADSTEFVKGIDKAKKAIADAKFDGGAVVAASAAFAAMGFAVMKAANAFGEAQFVQQQLVNTFKNLGQELDIGRMSAFADQFARLSAFDDEAVLGAANALARIGATQGQIEALLPSIGNLAAATGQDLPQAAQMVTRALAGNVGALTRQGIVVDEATKHILEYGTGAERTAAMVQLLGVYQGAATAQVNTAQGAFKQMGNAFGDLQESIGAILDQPLKDFLMLMTGAIRDVKRHLEGLNPSVKEFLGKAAIIATVAVGAVAGIGGIALAVGAMKTAIMGAAIPAIKTLVMTFLPLLAIGATLITVYGAVKRAMSGDFNSTGFADSIKKSFMAGIDSIKAQMLEVKGEIFSELKDESDDVGGKFDDLGKDADTLGDTLKSNAKKVRVAFNQEAPEFSTQMRGGGFDFGEDAFKEAAAASAKELDNIAATFGAGARNLKAKTDMEESLIKDMEAKSAALGDAISAPFIAAAQQAAPKVMEAVSAAQQGFKAGGIWGAIIAVIASLLSKLQLVVQVFGQAERGLSGTLQMLNDLFNQLNLDELVKTLTDGVMSSIQTLKTLGPLFQLLGIVIGGVAKGLDFILTGIAKIWNKILSQFVKLAKKFGFDDVAEKIRDMKIDLTAEVPIEDVNTDISTLGDATAETADTMTEASENMNKLNASLLNAPQGFKVALARFQSAQPTTLSGGGGMLSDTAPGTTVNNGNTIIVQKIEAGDVFSFYDKLQEVGRQRNFQMTGSGASLPSRYTPRYGV